MGVNDRAIITVSEDSSQLRRRFSIAHELGHWDLHRGQQFECGKSDIDNAANDPLNPERQADGYAADLLMPWYLFEPLLAQAKKVDLQLLEHMHRTFSCSMAATAIRIADANIEPVIIACYGADGRRWFCRSREVPNRWFPVGRVDPDCNAADVISGKRERTHMAPIGADAWFDEEGIRDYEICEQSVRLGDGTALVILRITEEAMQDEFPQRVWSHRDRR
jgi:hypothetical protein